MNRVSLDRESLDCREIAKTIQKSHICWTIKQQGDWKNFLLLDFFPQKNETELFTVFSVCSLEGAYRAFDKYLIQQTNNYFWSLFAFYKTIMGNKSKEREKDHVGAENNL